MVAQLIPSRDRPWTLDIASTEEMLGIGKSAAGSTAAGESLDAWITRLGGNTDGDRLRLFLTMLYTCCAAGCCLVCAFLMSVTVGFALPCHDSATAQIETLGAQNNVSSLASFSRRGIVRSSSPCRSSCASGSRSTRASTRCSSAVRGTHSPSTLPSSVSNRATPPPQQAQGQTQN